MASLGLSFIICQISLSQPQAHGALRRPNRTVCIRHSASPHLGHWLLVSTIVAKVPLTQRWRPKLQGTRFHQRIQPALVTAACGSARRVNSQLLSLQASQDAGATRGHESASTRVCSQASPPRAAPHGLTPAHRGPAAAGRGPGAGPGWEACAFSRPAVPRQGVREHMLLGGVGLE